MERVLLLREIQRRVDPESDLRAFASRLYRMEKAGVFPERVRIGMRRVGWRESEVQTWFDNLARGVKPMERAVKGQRRSRRA
jgi:hypothetical protein